MKKVLISLSALALLGSSTALAATAPAVNATNPAANAAAAKEAAKLAKKAAAAKAKAAKLARAAAAARAKADANPGNMKLAALAAKAEQQAAAAEAEASSYEAAAAAASSGDLAAAAAVSTGAASSAIAAASVELLDDEDDDEIEEVDSSAADEGPSKAERRAAIAQRKAQRLARVQELLAKVGATEVKFAKGADGKITYSYKLKGSQKSHVITAAKGYSAADDAASSSAAAQSAIAAARARLHEAAKAPKDSTALPSTTGSSATTNLLDTNKLISLENANKLQKNISHIDEKLKAAVAALKDNEHAKLNAAKDKVGKVAKQAALAHSALKNAIELKKSEELKRTSELARLLDKYNNLSKDAANANGAGDGEFIALQKILYGKDSNKLASARTDLSADFKKHAAADTLNVAELEKASKAALTLAQKAKANMDAAEALKRVSVSGVTESKAEDQNTDLYKAHAKAKKTFEDAVKLYKDLRAAQELARMAALEKVEKLVDGSTAGAINKTEDTKGALVVTKTALVENNTPATLKTSFANTSAITDLEAIKYRELEAAAKTIKDTAAAALTEDEKNKLNEAETDKDSDALKSARAAAKAYSDVEKLGKIISQAEQILRIKTLEAAQKAIGDADTVSDSIAAKIKTFKEEVFDKVSGSTTLDESKLKNPETATLSTIDDVKTKINEISTKLENVLSSVRTEVYKTTDTDGTSRIEKVSSSSGKKEKDEDQTASKGDLLLAKEAVLKMSTDIAALYTDSSGNKVLSNTTVTNQSTDAAKAKVITDALNSIKTETIDTAIKSEKRAFRDIDNKTEYKSTDKVEDKLKEIVAKNYAETTFAATTAGQGAKHLIDLLDHDYDKTASTGGMKDATTAKTNQSSELDKTWAAFDDANFGTGDGKGLLDSADTTGTVKSGSNGTTEITGTDYAAKATAALGQAKNNTNGTLSKMESTLGAATADGSVSKAFYDELKAEITADKTNGLASKDASAEKYTYTKKDGTTVELDLTKDGNKDGTDVSDLVSNLADIYEDGKSKLEGAKYNATADGKIDGDENQPEEIATTKRRTKNTAIKAIVEIAVASDAVKELEKDSEKITVADAVSTQSGITETNDSLASAIKAADDADADTAEQLLQDAVELEAAALADDAKENEELDNE